ncbi:MAG: CDF family Co(II)/Ni(II) efflux transporter DmeF [Hyphomicrobiales bacterium]|nr:CDF family Co(II)/Ni(II) efflux transporter DmeF [Hyphomicrobiales bacterium]
MHIHTLDDWRHDHVYVDEAAGRGERRTRLVIALTAVMMVAEIAAGLAFGSLALLADGWHMATHAAALGITALAYWYARRHARSRRFTFGTGKVGVLGGYTSAVILAGVALAMVWAAAGRLLDPVAIRFDEAMAVAALGLAVNLLSAWLLRHDHDHNHHHGHHDHDHGHHDHDHGHGHVDARDHNLRAAFLHVLADAVTSVAAIVALLAGKVLGWVWLDPVVAVAGAAVIGVWAWGLMRDSGRVLLDGAVPEALRRKVTAAIEGDADNRVADLHLWRVGPRHLAAIVSVVTHRPRPPAHYKALLRRVPGLCHVTVEVEPCVGDPCLPLDRAAGAAGP